MIGAIIGDIVGSRFEFNNHLSKDFEFINEDCFFTDDTVCTMATIDFIIYRPEHFNSLYYARVLKSYCKQYPHLSYGARFGLWLESPGFLEPYYSFGNGSAMRVSPISVMPVSLDLALENAAITASATHNHPEGIKGAQAAALAGYLAFNGSSKGDIKNSIEARFSYDLNFTCDEIRETYEFNETCQQTVPQAIVAFLESSSFEDAIRNAISIGGDSDTLAAITGGIAEAYYKEIPTEFKEAALSLLPENYKELLKSFYEGLSSTNNPIGRLCL